MPDLELTSGEECCDARRVVGNPRRLLDVVERQAHDAVRDVGLVVIGELDEEPAA